MIQSDPESVSRVQGLSRMTAAPGVFPKFGMDRFSKVSLDVARSLGDLETGGFASVL